MPAGLEVYDKVGNTVLTVTDSITRILTTDEFAYVDNFTKTYEYPEFLTGKPFVICSSFNSYVSVVDSADVYISGANPVPDQQCIWYQITWSIDGSVLTLRGAKSSFYVYPAVGSIRTARIAKPPFKLIIGVY